MTPLHIRILPTAVLMVLLSACETELIRFSSASHVRFTETSMTVKESQSETVAVEVHLASPNAESDLSISYSIAGTARAGVDYNIVGDNRSITIPAGEYKGFILVNLINNANNILRSQTLVFTLQSVNQPEVQVGQGVSGIGKQFTLTIEDDCILSGTYSGRIGTFDIPTRNITISSADCETYTLSNWNLNIFNPPFEMDLLFVDNGDNTITIPEQDEEFLSEDINTFQGIGVIDPVTRRLTLTLTFIDLESQQLTLVFVPE